MKKIRIGSRESRLAVLQSRLISEEIKKKLPNVETKIITYKTTGDKRLDISLEKIGGKGLFVKELDLALLKRKADITVHSLKDMPMDTNPALPVIAYSKRANPFDALVLPKGATEIDFQKPIGCSSFRRKLQFSALFPYAKIMPIRGNVLTRLEKLDKGEYSAIILAAAGLERLGLSYRISRLFSPEEILPAAGQGIMAVQCLKDGGFEYIECVDDKDGHICALAERACIRALGGGCSSPAAAFCAIEGERLHIRGFNVKEGQLVYEEIFADIDQGEEAGRQLAERLL